ncbi:unnamed protein product [Triticum turgidum subsp. durum]|uniref:Uncharacterized protein n=1 Tax=Triticum turgidum subsp. durum TaxID=4567 RepID=A0A9R1RXM6_TRITD|nr:unnamed protein product [Triticum turgidum subsp. durum]
MKWLIFPWVETKALGLVPKDDKNSNPGKTKDVKLCIVHLTFEGVNDEMLFVWLWGKDSYGVERWVFDKSFPLRIIAEFIKCSMVIHCKVGILYVIDGFMYLSVD